MATKKDKQFTDNDRVIFQAGVNEGELRSRREIDNLKHQLAVLKESYEEIAQINEGLLSHKKYHYLNSQKVIARLLVANRVFRREFWRLDVFDPIPEARTTLRINERYLKGLLTVLQKGSNYYLLKTIRKTISEQLPHYKLRENKSCKVGDKK
ncbi:MAG: hypothetical protein PHH26_00760 [Candidatus Thermoplasmatota archaeon]|nr:hypothetical protein [Candidatus Thermoplasmatota archaeon]